jgi:tetratricopeptide (TPR) repeat protein
MGVYDQAIVAARRALALATDSRDVVLQALTNQHLGTVYYSQGDYRRAIDCLRQTVKFFEGVRRCERFGEVLPPAVYSRAYLAECHRPLVAHCHHGLGRLYGQTGRGEQARAALTTAIDLYRAMDMTFWLPQAEAVLAQVGAAPAPRVG